MTLGAVTARHDFERNALESYLQAHLADFRGPLDVKQFHGGQSNPTYLLTTPNAEYVMRSKPGPVAKLLPSAHAIEREYRVMSALASQGIPVP
ncbi:MAG: phosphotransferase, partial [Pseudomonadota bacterium]|nr:phosphotransferase [Pseudomonadota bacterium]